MNEFDESGGRRLYEFYCKHADGFNDDAWDELSVTYQAIWNDIADDVGVEPLKLAPGGHEIKFRTSESAFSFVWQGKCDDHMREMMLEMLEKALSEGGVQ